MQQNYACTPQLLVACWTHFYSQILKKMRAPTERIGNADISKELTDSFSPVIFPGIFQASKLARFGSPFFLDRFRSTLSTANCSCCHFQSQVPTSWVEYQIAELPNVSFDTCFCIWYNTYTTIIITIYIYIYMSKKQECHETSMVYNGMCIYIYTGAARFPGPQESCQSTCSYVQIMLLSDAIASLNIFLHRSQSVM